MINGTPIWETLVVNGFAVKNKIVLALVKIYSISLQEETWTITCSKQQPVFSAFFLLYQYCLWAIAV